jgi:Ni/Co efflux regulator RcnB
MKRIIAGLALASAAALMTAAPAQAAPADPAKALKKQYVAGHGVRFSETTRTSTDGKSGGTSSATGVLAFGKSGIVASDVRNRAKGKDAQIFSSLMPNRMITLGKYAYAQGGIYSEGLPEGKKWVRYPNGGVGYTRYNQMLDIFEPKVLNTLVTHAKSTKGGIYRGSLTMKELSKLYGEKVDKKIGKIEIGYLLAVNAKGLVTRVVSDWTLDFGLLGKSRSTTETRFTGWGAKVTVKAPPADQVIDVSDLTEDSEVPQDIPNGSLNSLGGVK